MQICKKAHCLFDSISFYSYVFALTALGLLMMTFTPDLHAAWLRNQAARYGLVSLSNIYVFGQQDTFDAEKKTVEQDIRQFIMDHERESARYYLDWWLGMLYLESGDTTSAKIMVDRVRGQDIVPDFRQRYLAALQAYIAGDQKTAIAVSCKRPTLRNFWVGLADNVTDLGERNRLFGIGLSCQDPESPYYAPENNPFVSLTIALQYWTYARSLAKEGRYEETLDAHRQAIKLAPYHPALLFLYARRLWSSRGSEAAGEVLSILDRVDSLPNSGQYGKWARSLRREVLSQMDSDSKK